MQENNYETWEIDRSPYEKGNGKLCEVCESPTDFVTYKDSCKNYWYSHECTNPECKFCEDLEPMDNDDVETQMDDDSAD